MRSGRHAEELVRAYACYDETIKDHRQCGKEM